ncbi:HTH domain-containing protein [Cetobacterium sp.]|uniref:HTH domain-containing protein n=1 Tax=Cetobacterium sp. TaxID=2071632 RepID=UPI003F346CBA
MSVIIYSRHLRVLNLLNFTKGENLDFLELSLKLSKANLNLYIKDIYSSIPNVQKTNKLDLITKEILNCDDLFSKLKEIQVISKEERVFFLILKLLIEGNLNLENLSKKLEVSRRTLNGDLVDIKKDLENFQLFIESHTGKGVFLTGENINRKRALSCYIYKFLIEEPYLPKTFTDYFSFLIHNDEIDLFLKKDIEKFLSHCNMDNFFCNRELLKSFYISFQYVDDPGKNYKESLKYTLKDFSIFKFYFSKIFSDKDLDTFYDVLHDSLFKNIDFNEIPYFLNILRICTGNFPEESIYYNDHLLVWRDVIKKNLNRSLTSKEESALKKIILRVGFASKQKHYIPVQEFSFLNLNMEKETIETCISLFNDLKYHYWNISFTDIMSIFFTLSSIKKEKKEIVVLYKNIPKYIVENLKEQLEHKYNVLITDFINLHFFETFKKNNPVKTVGVFTEFEFDFDDLEIIKLDLNF